MEYLLYRDPRNAAQLRHMILAQQRMDRISVLFVVLLVGILFAGVGAFGAEPYVVLFLCGVAYLRGYVERVWVSEEELIRRWVAQYRRSSFRSRHMLKLCAELEKRK